MRRNPYAIAASRAAVKMTMSLPPPPAHLKPNPIPTRVGDFFDAMTIGHPANRAKVATAVAHTLTTEEVHDAIKRLLGEREEKVKAYKEAGLPDFLVKNAMRLNHADVGILNRVLKSRGLQPVV